MFSATDTIVAIATPPGRGGIGVVRISGGTALDVARALLAGSPALQPRHATLARLLDVAGREVDEVLATFFPAPHSYTAEDVVEISAHGSPALMRTLLRAAQGAGARLAEPGEFTFRAYLNGRLDLVQAEAVADLVDAVTPLQARVAFDQLEGTLTRAIGEFDRTLFDLVVKLEASLDFPDEGYHFVETGEAAEVLGGVAAGIRRLLGDARLGRLIREGQRIAILGRPNVGKSRLFNWLVGSDRAIVADHPGTTRDLVTETIDFEGIRLGLVDTAGIRDGADAIEREGVGRARMAGAVADVVLVVCDVSSAPVDEDCDVLGAVDGPRVVVLNKCDLGEDTAWAESELGLFRSGDVVVTCSLETGAGLDGLRAAIRRVLGSEHADSDREIPLVTNARHEGLLREALESIERALSGLRERGAEAREELVLADVASARRAFEDICGRRAPDAVLTAVFQRFCIGK